MSLNGINAGYAATAATAIEKVLNGQKMPHWLPS